MITDKQLLLAEEETTLTDGSFTDAVPLQETGALPEEFGEPLEVVIQATEDWDGGTNLTFHFGTASAADGTNFQIQATSAQLTAFDAGDKIRLPIALNAADADATHIMVRLNVTGTWTDGAYDAWIQRAREDQSTINDLGVTLDS